MARPRTMGEPAEALRRRYADSIMRLAGVDDARIRQVFGAVPREAFLPEPPWTVISGGATSRTSDLADIYTDVLVSLDRRLGINNGEPALHAAWLAAVNPQPGETAVHVGAGSGYYTAMLSLLVGEAGRVEAFEVHEGLAAEAARNLAAYPNARVHHDSAFGRRLPSADIVYVNAGVFSPDPEWLRALRPGGRLIFPWQPDAPWGPAMLVTRRRRGFEARPIMSVGFITCADQPLGRSGEITRLGVEATRSVWLREDRAPDASATAIYDALWFSADAVEG
jgi:protein-L-isoaspartate(D-aspartate) O-methyltransferase